MAQNSQLYNQCPVEMSYQLVFHTAHSFCLFAGGASGLALPEFFPGFANGGLHYYRVCLESMGLGHRETTASKVCQELVACGVFLQHKRCVCIGSCEGSQHPCIPCPEASDTCHGASGKILDRGQYTFQRNYVIRAHCCVR